MGAAKAASNQAWTGPEKFGEKGGEKGGEKVGEKRGALPIVRDYRYGFFPRLVTTERG